MPNKVLQQQQSITSLRDFAMSIAKASSILFLRGEEKWLIGK
jgi:hypothetical protein